MRNEKNGESGKRVLVFDAFGDYAHFRKIYTTTSPLSYQIPPRTALCGLIGAILGLRKANNEYLKHFTLDKAKIGLKVLNPIKKVVIAENLIHTKKGEGCEGIGMNIIKKRTQINFEFLKDPKYRIYFWHNDEELYLRLKNNLAEHKTVYTPCLGLSENIANFEYAGEFGVTERYTQSGFSEIHSVIPMEKIFENDGINFGVAERDYFPVKLPIEMSQERVVTKYGNVLIEQNGSPIEAKIIGSYWEIDYRNGAKENIVFIE
jgi:CRISPR-associated protein Cas5h